MGLEKARIHLSNSYYYQYGRFAGVEKDLDKSIEELRSALREIHKWSSEFVHKGDKW